jgi:hypothetical protein
MGCWELNLIMVLVAMEVKGMAKGDREEEDGGRVSSCRGELQS